MWGGATSQLIQTYVTLCIPPFCESAFFVSPRRSLLIGILGILLSFLTCASKKADGNVAAEAVETRDEPGDVHG